MNIVKINAVELRKTISDTILSMEKPFKLSQLYEELKGKDIVDKYLILEVLNQLYENGLVERTDIEDDVSEYRTNLY